MAKKKNANGMGNWFYDEKRKLHIFRISVDVDGLLKPKSFSGRTQEIASKKYEEWKRAGSFVSSDPLITMGDWANEWFDYYSDKIEASTVGSYYYTKEHIRKAFLNVKVRDMNVDHVEKFLSRMAKEYSASLCGKCRAMLGQMLRRAEAKNLINKNPVPLADKINYRRMKKSNGKHTKKDAFSATEVVALMHHLPETRIGHSIRLMLGCGISTQELLGLTTMDIAPDGSYVNVCRAVKIEKGGGMYIGDVKAERRERVTPVPPESRPSAVFLRSNSNGFILQGRNPELPIHPTTYRDFYKSAISQVPGVRYLTPHCCRHTYISHMQDRGVDFAVIQALAGQSEKASTITYIHPQSPAIAAAVSSIEALLTGK